MFMGVNILLLLLFFCFPGWPLTSVEDHQGDIEAQQAFIVQRINGLFW